VRTACPDIAATCDLARAFTALLAGVSTARNSGAVEGHVIRIKMLKRQM
jgi:transposase